MSTNKLHFSCGMLILILCMAGCTHINPSHNIPNGFAAYNNLENIRAVSPDGILYRIRTEKNEPYAELPFWKKALKKRMIDSGYIFIGEEDISASDQKGYLLELATPVGAADHAYIIAVFTNNKKQLIIVESSGEIAVFKQRKEDVINAIKQIKIN